MNTFQSLFNKYSGTCFIIGSGSSLATQNLDFLKRYTSIAVNAGYWRYPSADFFVSDDEDSSSWQYFYDTLKKSDKTKVLLYEWKFRKFGNWKECEDFFGDRLFSFSHSDNYSLTHNYEHNNPKKGLWRARTSAGTAIHCAYLMGFRKIVLLGIDCCYVDGKRHFYEFDGYSKPIRRKPVVQRRFVKKIDNYQTDTDLMDILLYWNSLYKVINNHFELLNASPISIIKNTPKIDVTSLV